MGNESVIQSDEDIIRQYTKQIIDGDFKFKSADPNRGQTGSGIADALRRLESDENDWTGELETSSKEILLTFAIRQFWNEFKAMRFFLKDPWEKWEEYLRMRLF